MGASSETFSKREKEKARQKKKQDKQEKREERKTTVNKGHDLEQMLAYVDEYGNLSTTPPNPRNQQSVDLNDIVIGVARRGPEAPEDLLRTGMVTMFNAAKGYGFIRDLQNQQSVFVHQNELQEPVGEGDKVTFETQNTPKGVSAIRVKKAAKNG